MNAPVVKPRRIPREITTDAYVSLSLHMRIKKHAYAEGFADGFDAGRVSMHRELKGGDK